MVQPFVRMVFAACFVLPLGCAANEEAPAPKDAKAEKPPTVVRPFTAETARDALVVMVRERPNGLDRFMEPDRIAKGPIEKAGGQDTFFISEFHVNLKERSYSAMFGPAARKGGAGDFFGFSGTFELISNQWIASSPKLQQGHVTWPQSEPYK